MSRRVTREEVLAADFSGLLALAAVIDLPPTSAEDEGDVVRDLAASDWALIRDALLARRDLGIARYGRPLPYDSRTRPPLLDAIHEALDLLAYGSAMNPVGLPRQFDVLWNCAVAWLYSIDEDELREALLTVVDGTP